MPRAVLLGRDQEVQLLEGVLNGALDGEAGFVVVAGEAGIGKTTLLGELAEIANRRGCLTLGGTGSELDQELPFGLFVDAVDAYLNSLESEAMDSLAEDRLGVLAAVFPSLRILHDAVDYPATATERFRFHRAVRELLERLAARRPMVLILDDLHWADGSSLELIAYLLRHPPHGEVMLAMALRPGHGSPEVIRRVRTIQSSHAVRNLDVGPLSFESTELLVGEDAERVHQVSGGNPFYALQLARMGGGPDGDGSLDALGVPSEVARAIAGELAGLSPGARALAEVAAVVGDPFDVDIAAEVSDRSETEVLDELDELVAKDLVRGTDLPRRFRFRHPIVRSAVYGSCLPSVRLSCHSRAAAALTKRGASAGERAHHVEQSARFGDKEAVAVLQRAGEEAADLAPTSAIHWFHAALRLLPEEGEETERVRLLMSLSASLAVLGRFQEALDALEEGLALSLPNEEQAVLLVVASAQMEQLLGRNYDSRTRLERAYEALDDDLTLAGVSLEIALALAYFQLGDYRLALEWGGRAAKAAESLGNVTLLAAAMATQAMGGALAGHVDLAKGIRDRTANLVDSLADQDLEARLDALINLAGAEIYLDLYSEAASHAERCLTLARAVGETQLMPIIAPVLGSSLWMVGEMAKSAEVLDDAIEAARLSDNLPALAWTLFNKALTVFMAGDVESALELSTESVEISRAHDSGLVSAWAGAVHAQVLLEMGESEGARDLLLTSLGGEELPRMPGSWRPTYFEVLTHCYLALGDVGSAEVAASRARRQADEYGMGMPGLMADRAQAAVALAEGRPEDAVLLATSAVDRSEEIGARVHQAISHALAGRALVAAGRRDEAIVQLERAASLFETLEARRYRDQVDAQLRQLGHTVHRRTRPGRLDGKGISALTGRETEVAELVLDRLTNREIAQQLFLSIKTVETHIRNIFNKLGVSSRVEVARILIRAQESGD